ncbi:hypothetical protein ES703_87619 [subsurface metagenome]
MLRYKRRLLSGLLVACIVLSIGGFSAFVKAEELHIAINKSPWFPAFEKVVRLYEKKTGIKMMLHAFPFEGLFEKQLAALATGSERFDLMNVNEWWGGLFYSGGFMTPIKEIDPAFKVPPDLIEFYWEGYWDEKVHYQTKTGTLYGIPINGNIHLFAYRKDKYEEAGLSTPPETWDDVLLAAKKLHNPPNFYGYVPRGFRGEPTVYNSTTVRHAYGGYIFADPAHGDFTITVNDKKNQQGVDMYYKKLAKYSPPGAGLINQAQMMAHLATGKALQAIQVSAAWPHYDDPDFSIVPYKIEYAVPPRADIEGSRPTSTVALWTMAVPRFISQERKVRALNFLKWLITEEVQVLYTELKAVPVSRSVFESHLMKDKKYRFLKAMRDALPYVESLPLIPELPQIHDKMGLHLNRIIIGEEGVKEALDKVAAEILEIMKNAGYKGIKIASSQ